MPAGEPRGGHGGVAVTIAQRLVPGGHVIGDGMFAEPRTARRPAGAGRLLIGELIGQMEARPVAEDFVAQAPRAQNSAV